MDKILTASQVPVEATLGGETTWQEAMKRAVRSGRELCERLGLPSELVAPKAEEDFPVFVPLEYLARMEPGNLSDPLLRQVLAVGQELQDVHGSLLDAVGDSAAERIPGLLQKYAGRALLMTTGACAVHCRYCFRRHYPYHTVPVGKEGWEPALEQLATDNSLEEVILSGGDPLTVNDGSLAWLTSRIASFPHVRRLRIHTRVPVVIPQRVCRSLLEWLSALPLSTIIVLHFNHAAEIDPTVARSLAALRQAGALLLNQAVLLRGVNDSLQAQMSLCQSLVNLQVIPYYLHQLDPVQGAMHFGVTDEQALRIIAQLVDCLPGYAVPKLVREIAGEKAKRRLA